MKTVAESRAKRPSKKSIPAPPSSKVARKRPRVAPVTPRESATTRTLRTIAATGTTLIAMGVARHVLATYPWPSLDIAIYAAVSDVIVPEILTSPAPTYAATEYWYKRVSDELAARGVPSAPAPVEAMNDAIRTLETIFDLLSTSNIAPKAVKVRAGEEREQVILAEVRSAAAHARKLVSRLRLARRSAA